MTEHMPEDDNNIPTDFTSQISETLKLESPCNSGSFGVVYRRTIKLSKGSMEVAVKVFKIDPGRTVEKIEKTMRRELLVWLRLKHSTIVPLLGTANVDSPFPALISQWMSSGTLYMYLEQASMTVSAKVELAIGVADGLNYLHSVNVIHGDLHPANVLVDNSGNPRLTDFGLATVAGDAELQLSNTTATRTLDSRWRAPEIVGIERDPEKPSFKSDMFSFGGVMFFILSEDVPWKEKNPVQICIVLSQKVEHTRPDNILDDHWSFIQKCWSWDPDNRPDAGDVIKCIAPKNIIISGELGTRRSSTIPPEMAESTIQTMRPEMTESAIRTTPPEMVDSTIQAIPTEMTESTNQTIRPEMIPSTIRTISSRNIVIFGETGAGKSSVINLMAGQNIAHTSPDSHRCTLHWTEYPITFDTGTRYKVFDTVGLEEPRLQTEEYLATVSNAYGLVNILKERGGIDLLLFCIRPGRVTPTMQSNYRLFFEFLCEEKVPLALVVTNLERETRMEDWYERNVGHLEKRNIRSVGHACITAANTLDGRHRDKYEESRGIIRRVVEAHCNSSMEGWTGGQGWFGLFIAKLVELVVKRPKKTDVIGILTKRCGMTKEVARRVAQHIRDENQS